MPKCNTEDKWAKKPPLILGSVCNQLLLNQMVKQMNQFKKAICIFFICFAGQTVQAQNFPKVAQYFDLGLATDLGNVYSGSISWNRSHGIFSGNKFRLGYGLRYHLLGGTDLTYTSAPLRLTSEESNVDSLNVASPLTMGLNALISIQYHFSPKVHIGFNIDALGIGFGRSGTSDFISSENRGAFPDQISASPTGFNVLLGGDNDIGQLKSELYIAYALNEKIALRAGFDYTFSEYTTGQKLLNENDRFRYKAPLGFIAFSYSPNFKKQ
jgi:hypothetical protein